MVAAEVARGKADGPAVGADVEGGAGLDEAGGEADAAPDVAGEGVFLGGGGGQGEGELDGGGGEARREEGGENREAQKAREEVGRAGCGGGV